MNKQFLRFLLCLLIYLTLPLAATAQVVDIPDPNLRAAIENSLGKASGAPITVSEMATLTRLEARNANISDLTGLEHATNLIDIDIGEGEVSEPAGANSNSISDLSPLTKLTNLRDLNFGSNAVSDLSPLAGLTNLRVLYIYNNPISDLSPLTGLTNLESLYAWWVRVTDLSPLTRLTNLRALLIHGSGSISDISSLAGMTNLEVLSLWGEDVSDLSPLSGLTELGRLDLRYNSISDLSPLVANTGVGDGDVITVFGNPLSDASIDTHIPALRSRGVTVHNTHIYFPTINPVRVGDTATLSVVVDDVADLAGWQLDIAFNPVVLEAVSVREGDFLSTEGGNTFFVGDNIDNANGKITGVSAALIGTSGSSGTGILLEVTFEAKRSGEGRLRLEKVRLGDSNGKEIPHHIINRPFRFKPSYDVNGDGNVNIFDLIIVSQNFNKTNPQVDVNGDGTVNIFDLIVVAQHLGESTTGDAPTISLVHVVSLETIQAWIDLAHAADDGSLAFQLGIANLKRLLTTVRPDTTALLANYPNPFNPETWIPYHLAHDTEVTLTIYDIKGAVVRRLDLGHQMAGYYADRIKAAYWDGRNNLGESVGSGVYFYQLQAEDFSAIRKMVILK